MGMNDYMNYGYQSSNKNHALGYLSFCNYLRKIKPLRSGLSLELVTGLEPATSYYNKAKIPIQMYRDSLSYSVCFLFSALRTSYIRKVSPINKHKLLYKYCD